jgi:hypothetical protein
MATDILILQSTSPQLQIEEAHQQEEIDIGLVDRPGTAPRQHPLHPNGFATLNRSSTGLFAPRSRNASRDASPAPSGRPGLQRAKSDFGPRGREDVNRAGEEPEAKDGEWGLRHGFETQLESEEYNRLLESVCGGLLGFKAWHKN